MPKAKPRNQRTKSKKLPQSQSLVAPDNQSIEARTLVKAEATGTSLQQARKTLLEEAAENFILKKHDLTTNGGAAQAVNDMFNLWKLDREGKYLSGKEMNTGAYTIGIALKAIKAVQEEENPSESVGVLAGDITITMTKETRKLLLTAGSPDKMGKILAAAKKEGEILQLEKSDDGAYAVRPIMEPPRSDAAMPVSDLSNALQESGEDVSKAEVRAIVGPSLGDLHGNTKSVDVETFGFDGLLDVEPKSEPLIQHDWQTTSYPHPQLPGVVVRVSRCTRCGITTKNTRNHENEMCGAV